MHKWTFELVGTTSACLPPPDAAVLEIRPGRDGDGNSRWEYDLTPVVLLRTQVVDHYHSDADDEPATAPTHRELAKAGWVYDHTSTRTEPLVSDGDTFVPFEGHHSLAHTYLPRKPGLEGIAEVVRTLAQAFEPVGVAT